MFMVLKGDQHSSHPEYFSQIFKLRYEMFVNRRQWSLPAKNGFEIDQYDTDDAYYFMLLSDHDGSIETFLRMTPTMQSSLMADYFPHLNEANVELRSPRIYEATRYMLLPKERSANYSRKLKSTFFASLIEWCIDRDLDYMQSVIDAVALRTFVEMSLRTQPLGLPHPFGGGPSVRGGGECLGFRWPISRDLVDDFIIYGDQSRPAETPLNNRSIVLQ
jgi:acyl-homoserine lactone synthase